MRTWGLVLLCALAGPALVAACGSRTGLLSSAPSDASTSDSPPDAAEEADAGEEVGDAPFVVPDGPDICPDAGATLIYLITETNDLFSFYPPTLAFRHIGPLSCPGAGTATPFSMAVDRQGIGRSSFSDGTLYLVDMRTAACVGTTFQPDQLGFQTFCMGYAANDADGGDAGETLYVAECNVLQSPPPDSMGLATLDTASLTLSYVAPFSPPIRGPELTGTGDGRLFGFYTNPNQNETGSHIVQIDRGTGAILQDYPLQVGTPNDGYAFAFWGGVFWVFTFSGPSLPTIVTRFDPATRSETMVASMPEGVVGAGVSTCAPM
ncbi:MAG TPA: hypothetical protein VF765_32710 [Polyangiaceae bacterium]